MSTARKTALITGGSRGIGLGIARALAMSGFDLAINGRRPEGEVLAVLNELQSMEVHAIYARGDIAKVDEHAKLLDRVRDRFGRLDLLVNNAGVAPDARADILDASLDSFDRLIGINLRGPYFLTQAVARWMIEQRRADNRFRGCLVNVSSVSAAVASVDRGDYCVSKAGVAMASQLWAVRLAEFGIDVYEVRPGIIATDMTSGVKAKYDALLADGLVLEKRWGTPDDVGKAVAALARNDIPYATGQILNVDGGMMIKHL